MAPISFCGLIRRRAALLSICLTAGLANGVAARPTDAPRPHASVAGVARSPASRSRAIQAPTRAAVGSTSPAAGQPARDTADRGAASKAAAPAGASSPDTAARRKAGAVAPAPDQAGSRRLSPSIRPSRLAENLAFGWPALILVCTLLVIAFPLVVLAFYWLRLSLRRKLILDRVREMDLQSEYLRLYDGKHWDTVRRDPAALEATFTKAVRTQFRGDNRGFAFFFPSLLFFLTTAAFAAITLAIWLRSDTDAEILTAPVLFALAGAFTYAYPQLVSRYSTLTLTPQSLYELLGGLWLALLTGLAAAMLAEPTLKPVSAFIGSLLPLPVLGLLRQRLSAAQTDAEKAAAEERQRLAEIVGSDDEVVTQLGYVGIRSVRALANENPIRLFVEVVPNLSFCFDMVDRANLVQWVPDPGNRKALNGLGIRGAIDLMTQVHLSLPPRRDPAAEPVDRFLEPDEPVPPYLLPPLQAMARACQMADVETLRNMLAAMSEDPALVYLQRLWWLVGESVEAAIPAVAAGGGT